VAASLILEKVDWAAVGERLKASRNAVGLSQAEAAGTLGVARTTVVAIEKGQRRLSAGDLVALAKLYRQEVNDLLRNRPSNPELAVQFKAYLKNPLLGELDQTELQQASSLLQSLCESYLELERILEAPLPQRYPATYDYHGIAIEAAADEIASQERTRLDLGDGPISDMRGVLENDVGLRIFYLELPSWIAGLFGYTTDLGGCVAINSKHPPERRRISLAHEYCHFLTDRFRADVQVTRAYSRMPESERLAEAFARRFTMPEAGMRRHLRRHLQASGRENVVVGDLVQLAQYYRVSFEAYVRRLEEMNVIGLGTYEKLRDQKFQVRRAQSHLNLRTEVRTNEARLPSRYQLLAVTAFLHGEITEGQLAGFLSVSRLEARELVERLSGQVTLDEEGHYSWAPWNVNEEVPVRV
jgi:Zn-dependent peptidase ImmA (M78 family)/DNA-binding XRE family transcriptional regulator